MVSADRWGDPVFTAVELAPFVPRFPNATAEHLVLHVANVNQYWRVQALRSDDEADAILAELKTDIEGTIARRTFRIVDGALCNLMRRLVRAHPSIALELILLWPVEDGQVALPEARRGERALVLAAFIEDLERMVNANGGEAESG